MSGRASSSSLLAFRGRGLTLSCCCLAYSHLPFRELVSSMSGTSWGHPDHCGVFHQPQAGFPGVLSVQFCGCFNVWMFFSIEERQSSLQSTACFRGATGLESEGPSASTSKAGFALFLKFLQQTALLAHFVLFQGPVWFNSVGGYVFILH